MELDIQCNHYDPKSDTNMESPHRREAKHRYVDPVQFFAPLLVIDYECPLVKDCLCIGLFNLIVCA